MSDESSFLITLLYGDELIRCALKVHNSLIDSDWEYLMEPETRAKIHALLPLHVRSCGPIVEVEAIFECHEALEGET